MLRDDDGLGDMAKINDFDVQVRELIARDKISEALDLLATRAGAGEAANEITLHRSRLSRLDREHRRGTITDQQWAASLAQLVSALLGLLGELEDGATTASRPGPRSVFISYSSRDRSVADRVVRFLAGREIKVQVDNQAMAPGEDIGLFIRRSIRDTDVTLSIVSEHSLRSDWVAMESVYTFYSEAQGERKKFIACYLDERFLNVDFRLVATIEIDKRIAEIDALIPEYIASKIDTVDLNERKSRLFTLRNHLGDILGRLRGSLCLDIRDEQFAASMERLAGEITIPP
jgi:hypothetical protein